MEINNLHQREATDWSKYLYAFVITAIIFGTAIYISNYFSDKKVNQIRNIEDDIALNILSSETQFALLTESSCQSLTNNTLSSEVGRLGQKLAFAEENLGTDNQEFQNLKRYYTILQVKDYLLMKKISEKCKNKPVFILYFYGNENDCADCQKEGYVLTRLHEMYPEIRIYSFDYNFDTPTIATLKDIYKLKDNLPALVLNGKTMYGFQELTTLQTAIPETKVWDKQRTATSTL